MASTARVTHCKLKAPRPAVRSREQKAPVQVSITKPKPVDPETTNNIVLQPRLCTLRSYGSDPAGVFKTRKEGVDGGDNVSPFFATLSEYIESSKKSQDFEIISGRLAMVSFACSIFFYRILI